MPSRSFAVLYYYFIQSISSILSLEYIIKQQKKTAAEIFNTAESNSIQPVEETDINSNPVSKVLQPGTKVNYNRIIDLWDKYISISLRIPEGIF